MLLAFTISMHTILFLQLCFLINVDQSCPIWGIRARSPLPNLLPKVNETLGRPNCAKDSLVCEEEVNYPRNFVRALLLNLKDCGLNLSHYPKRIKRQIDDHEPLCQHISEIWTPKVAQALNGEWKYVIQDVELGFTQVFQAERCREERRSCVESNFESICQTSYSAVRMLAIDPNSIDIPRTYMEEFRFPTCCKCYQDNFYQWI